MNSSVSELQFCISTELYGRRPQDSNSIISETDITPLRQRSISLTALQTSTPGQPRMAQLETLEAKMANIEVSLSNTPRRRKNGTICTQLRVLPGKEMSSKELEVLRNALKDKENVIQNLKSQLVTVPGIRLAAMRNQANSNSSIHTIHCRELTDSEKKQADDRLSQLKFDMDNKRIAIKNLKMALERLDITDNIDTRIQQAELEYQLGREELNLLTLNEETRTIHLLLEECNKGPEIDTLYRCVNVEGMVILKAFEVDYDEKNPTFGAGPRDSGAGLWIDWALEKTGLCKGDRLVEVNGKIVLTKNRDDLLRLLSAMPDPAQLVVLRKFNKDLEHSTQHDKFHQNMKEEFPLQQELEMFRQQADEAQKSNDDLKSDNIRLTHRISYLEEQVIELLNRNKISPERRNGHAAPEKVFDQNRTAITSSENVTQITVKNDPKPNGMQVFQKGPVTTILETNSNHTSNNQNSRTEIPVRSKSSLSNVSGNSHLHSKSEHTSCHCHRAHRHKHKSRNSLNTVHPVFEYNNNHVKKHHHHHHHHYNYDTDSVLEKSTKPTPIKNGDGSTNAFIGNKEQRDKIDKNLDPDVMDRNYKNATKIVEDLTQNNKFTSSYEKHRHNCLTASEKYNGDLLKHYNSRKSTSILDFRSEIHLGPKYIPSDAKSVDDIDDRNHNNGKICLDPYNTQSHHSEIRPNGIRKDINADQFETARRRERSQDHLSGYCSEGIKFRPLPPKKPLRLSLHKTHSLQSVEVAANGISKNNDPRKTTNNKLSRNDVSKLDHPLLGFWKRTENGCEATSWC